MYEQLLSRQKQFDGHQFTLTVNELKWVTDTKDGYKQFGNWERRVLQAGVDDLNAAGVSFLVKYTKNLRGRQYYSITFSCVERQSWRDTTYEEAWAAATMKEAQRRNQELVVDQPPQQSDPPEQQLSPYDIAPAPQEQTEDDIVNDKTELTADDMPF